MKHCALRVKTKDKRGRQTLCKNCLQTKCISRTCLSKTTKSSTRISANSSASMWAGYFCPKKRVCPAKRRISLMIRTSKIDAIQKWSLQGSELRGNWLRFVQLCFKRRKLSKRIPLSRTWSPTCLKRQLMSKCSSLSIWSRGRNLRNGSRNGTESSRISTLALPWAARASDFWMGLVRRKCGS